MPTTGADRDTSQRQSVCALGYPGRLVITGIQIGLVGSGQMYPMTVVLKHPVRFGEISHGPFIHTGVVFDLLIQATEELSHDLEYPAESIVAADGVPYAPVAIEAAMTQYPQYGDTILIDVEPIAIGDRHVQLEYRFERASDGSEFGRVAMVQVTITPDGHAEKVQPSVRSGLEALPGSDRDEIDVSPRPPQGDGPALSREMTFRTPHVEGAGLGYFEDYAQEMALCLETWLADRGKSVGSLTGDTYPFIPVEWALTLQESIQFEDQIEIVGRILEKDDRSVDIAFEFQRPATDDICIRADMTYGCFDGQGQRVVFPSEAMSGLNQE